MTRMYVDDFVLTDESGFACGKSKHIDCGLAHLRPFNISDDGSLDLSDVYHVPLSEAPAGKHSLLAGDILFNNTNSVEMVGKSAIVPRDMIAGFSNHLTRIRINSNVVEPKYFALWLRSLRGTGFFSVSVVLSPLTR